MAVFYREDGVYFALRPYRELLSVKRASLFKKELELLANDHGHYVRLFRQPSGDWEAVFSREPGYLLGEAVWRYFDKPPNLIYCEALPNKQEAMVVIARDGLIYLDAQLSFAELEEELKTLDMVSGQFVSKIYGNITLFPDNQRQTGILATLPVDAEVHLAPYQRVIDELSPSRPYMAWVFGGLVLLGGAAWLMNALSPANKQGEIVITDPLAHYRAVFSGSSVSAQLSALMSQIELLYGLPGWTAGTITSTPGNISVRLNSLGGTTGMLLAWAQQHQVQVSLGSGGAALTMIVQMDSRQAIIPPLQPLQSVLSSVIDKMMTLLPGKSVTIGTLSSESGYRKSGMTIQVNDIAPYVLSLIGAALNQLPVIFTSSALTLKDGLLSGTIEFSALGS
jgi:hypothetical protein